MTELSAFFTCEVEGFLDSLCDSERVVAGFADWPHESVRTMRMAVRCSKKLQSLVLTLHEAAQTDVSKGLGFAAVVALMESCFSAVKLELELIERSRAADALLFATFHIPFEWTAINDVKRASLAVALNAVNVVLCERGRRVAVDAALRKQLQGTFHLAFRIYRFAEESHPELEAQVCSRVDTHGRTGYIRTAVVGVLLFASPSRCTRLCSYWVLSAYGAWFLFALALFL
jgi:hypothetical protein